MAFYEAKRKVNKQSCLVLQANRIIYIEMRTLTRFLGQILVSFLSHPTVHGGWSGWSDWNSCSKPVEPVFERVLGVAQAQRLVLAGKFAKELRRKVISVIRMRVQVDE